MPSKHRPFIRLAQLLLAAAVAGLLIYVAVCYVCVGFQFYPRGEAALDLTGRSLTAKQFDKLHKKLPDCDITWDVPLSTGSWPSDSEKIVLNALTREDVAALSYFTGLKQVDARECSDYEPLLALLEEFPHLDVTYILRLGQDRISPKAKRIQVRGVPAEEVSRLKCMRALEEVVCAGGQQADVQALREYCRDAGIAFYFRVGDALLTEQTRRAELANMEKDQLALLNLLPGLEQLHLKAPEASAGVLLELRENLRKTQITWELPVCGVVCNSEDRELNLDGGKADLEEIRRKLPYFPRAQMVYLGACGLDNETIAAFREEMRGTIKVVWQVSMGKKLTARTDDKSFMPLREGLYYFNDEEAYNLRYCEEMECIDIGHMSIHNIDFVEFMPNLTYLILAHTQVQYIEPIATCKNLKFLELDWSPVRDLSPLVGCTGLEDLNLGKTYANFEPIKQMTWLKNLWVINCNRGVAYQMSQALPDTKVQAAGDATVASGWRKLPNYYAMRDALGMYYMGWK